MVKRKLTLSDDELRVKLNSGITLKELSVQLGVNYKYFANYCKKRNIVKPDLIDWDKAKSMYLSGMSCKLVADELGISVSKLHSKLKSITRPKEKSMFGLVSEDVEVLKQRYLAGESATKIAVSIGLKHHNVERILKDEGIVLKGVDYSGNVDSHFFDVIDSEDKAYWLGFLAADGWIGSKNNVIGLSLQGNDALHLNKFKKSIQLNQEVKWRKSRDEVYVLFKSKQMYSALIKLGFTSNKSFDFVPPKLTKDLERHFWRGMVDGDGCISLSKSNYLSLDLSGTKASVFAFKEFLLAHNIRSEVPVDLKSYYRVNCWGFEASKALALLYEKSTISLNRKASIANSKMTPSGKEGCVNIGQFAAKEFILANHYLKTLPIGSICFGWFREGKLIGVAAFGSPTAPNSSKLYKNLKLIELRRFALLVNEPNLASKFLAAAVKELKLLEKYDLLFTFADRAQGHEGTIYKAIGMTCDSESGRQLVGVMGGSRLTGVHLERYIAKHGVSGIDFQDSPGKLKFSLKLK